MTDEDLVRRVVERDDRHAFATLVRRHQSAVRAFLRKLAGERALADDLAQDTFLRAYRALAGWRAESTLASWLLGIAYRVFVSYRRRPSRREEPADLADAAAASGTMRAAGVRHDLDRALASLPDDERAAVALVYGGELTHEEAAAALGWPVGTLKTRVLRAKERMRARLEDGELTVDEAGGGAKR